jgi:hypothetical protein
MNRSIANNLILVALLIGLLSGMGAQESSTTLRSESNTVLVPTLVTTKAGKVVYGLGAGDFIIEDDGIEQRTIVDDSPSAEPISLVVALQIGRKASLQFKKKDDASLYDRFYSEQERKDCRLRKHPCPTAISGLGTMLEALTEETRGEVAVITFDGDVYLFQDFTTDVPTLSRRLKVLTPGDDGAAILDALRFSLEILKLHAKNSRRVVLVVSEGRDHGSHSSTYPALVQQLTLSNTLVCSLTFSPSRSEFMQGLKAAPVSESTDLLAPIRASIDGMRKSLAVEIANLTGGEARRFKDKSTFDSAFASVDNDIRGRYLLSFQPRHPTPGPHTIRVRLRDSQRDLVLRARNGYWAVQNRP